MISDERLTQSLKEYEEAILAGFDEPESHTFSARFLRRMKPLFTRSRYGSGYLIVKRVACAAVTVVLLSGLLMTSPHVRAAAVTWFREIQNNWMIYESSQDASAQPGPETNIRYELGWVPSQYSLHDIISMSNGYSMIYVGFDGSMLTFDCIKAGGESGIRLHLEDAEHTQITINNKNADLYIESNPAIANAIVLPNEDESMLFVITGCIDKDSLIQIAKNIFENYSP